MRVDRGVGLSEQAAPGVSQQMPGFDVHASPNGFDIVQVGRQLEPPIATRGFADSALVEADASEFGQDRSRCGLHVVRHPGAAMQQEQRFAVLAALLHCEESTRGFHEELIHGGIFVQSGSPKEAPPTGT